jgi:Ni/Co efflux regulator RcnB
MLLTALLLTTLAVQQPTAAPAKPHANASQQADTTKAKTHRRRAHKAKARATTAPRDTTKAKP